MRKAIGTLIAILLAMAVALPLFYMLSASLFSPADFRAQPSRLLPESAVWSNYIRATSQRYFPRYMINSISISVLTVVGRLIISIMAGFALSFLKFKGKSLVAAILLSTLFVPQDALLYQNYSTIAALHLLDTWGGIIIPSLFSAAQTLLLIGTFKSISKDYYDAGRIDGAGDVAFIRMILVPLSQSTITVLAIQSFISSFNSYLWPLLVTNRPKARTIQIGLTMMGFAEEGQLGAQFASIAMITLPFLLLLGVGIRILRNAQIKGSLYS